VFGTGSETGTSLEGQKYRHRHSSWWAGSGATCKCDRPSPIIVVQHSEFYFKLQIHRQILICKSRKGGNCDALQLNGRPTSFSRYITVLS